MDKIKISEIPEILLELIRTNADKTVDYKSFEVYSIFRFRNQYRINTDNGQYRVDDAELLIY